MEQASFRIRPIINRILRILCLRPWTSRTRRRLDSDSEQSISPSPGRSHKAPDDQTLADPVSVPPRTTDGGVADLNLSHCGTGGQDTLIPAKHTTGPDDIGPDIKKLVCARCWETVFSTETFRAIWEGSAEGVRLKQKTSNLKELWESFLTYETPPWAEIQESAAALCGYCTLIRNEIRESRAYKSDQYRDPPADGTCFVAVLFDLASTYKEGPQLSITVWTDETSWMSETSIYAEPEDPAARYITARNVVWQMDDSTSYELALKCVDECSRHERCPRPIPTTLPTRVLDCVDPLRPRLVTTDASMKDFYTALSYVWGESQPHRTTTDNLDTYHISIDLAFIPKTIDDAITVTRRLGLRYLWVDSFCIIQDSEEDKAHEIARIRLNFRNAFVTIVAASANTVSEGFLHNTPPSHFAPIHLPFRCPDGAMGTITAIRRAPDLFEPVDDRAWCLEERVLSPRLLMFGALGLQYECQTGHVNVNGSPLGLPSSILRLPDYVFTAEGDQSLQWQSDMYWDTILQLYTRRKLTNERDKLLALTGVAEQLHRLWPQSQYAAGLWTHQLPRALLWQQSALEIRPRIYRAPSWSWAAVDGQLIPPGLTGDVDWWRSAADAPKDSEIICEVKLVDVALKHASNPYGEVTSASLVLSASIARATWNAREDTQPDELHIEEGTALSAQKLVLTGPRDMDRVGLVGLDAVDLPELPFVEVTLIGVTKDGVPLPLIKRLGQHDICGLMLLPASEKDESGVAVYRRIGEFRMNAENWPSTLRQDIHII